MTNHPLPPSVLVFLILLVTGMPCIAASAPHDSFKIGVLLPTTGPDAEKGLALYEGITAAQSIKPDIAGSPVTLISVDTESNDRSAEQAMKKLIGEDKVCAIIGDTGFITTERGCALAKSSEIPVVAPAIFDASLPSGCDFLFRICLPDLFQSVAGAWYAREELHIKNAAILIDISDEESINRAALFRKSFTDLGGNIVAIAYCQSGDVDFSIQIEHIISQKADLVFLPGAYPEIARFCIRASLLDFKGYLFATAHAHLRPLIELGGKSVEGLLLIDYFDSASLSTERGRLWANAYLDKNGREIHRINALGADAYFILCNALEHAQSLKGPAIRTALAGTADFAGVTGLITLDDDGNSRINGNLFQIKGGLFTYLKSINPVLKTN